MWEDGFKRALTPWSTRWCATALHLRSHVRWRHLLRPSHRWDRSVKTRLFQSVSQAGSQSVRQSGRQVVRQSVRASDGRCVSSSTSGARPPGIYYWEVASTWNNRNFWFAFPDCNFLFLFCFVLFLSDFWVWEINLPSCLGLRRMLASWQKVHTRWEKSTIFHLVIKKQFSCVNDQPS